MGIRIVQVDAFTSTPFAGNPAAVCVLPAPRDERWMQSVAQEMNLSETAFLHPGRRVPPPLVYAGCGSGPVRPRDARERARAVGGWPHARRRGGTVPDQERP